MTPFIDISKYPKLFTGINRLDLQSLIDRVNSLYGKAIPWLPSGDNPFTGFSNIGLIGYIIEPLFPYILQNQDSLDPASLLECFYTPELEAQEISQRIFTGAPDEFKSRYDLIRLDLPLPASHNDITMFDGQFIIMGDEDFTAPNTAVCYLWDNQFISCTVSDGVETYTFESFIQLFDTQPTRLDVIRVV